MEFNKKQIKDAMFLITFAIVLMWSLENISNIWLMAGRTLSIFSPFIIGLVIAFILNGPMKFIEENLFKNKNIFKNLRPNLKRPISFLITLLIFIITISIVLFIIIPELINTSQDLSVKLPSYWDDFLIFINSKLDNNPEIIKWFNNINFDWEVIEGNVITFFKNSALNIVGSTFAIASSVLNGIVTFILGFVFSIYILLQKETLNKQIKKFMLAFFPKKVAHKIFYIGNLSNNIFSSFLFGQFLESIIIGVLFFVSMSIFRLPYALMISVLIGITSLIPILGSFIGCIIGAFLILVINVKMAFWFIIMFLIIQQIEGNLIYPRVVGKASGLPSLWVLVAVTVGGSLMGVIGILLFIPLTSVLYALLSEYTNYRLKMKKLS